MPLLKFTAGDIQKSKILDDAWYGLTIKNCSEWEPAKANPPKPPSLNMTVTMVVEDQNEKEIELLINNTGMGFHVGFFAAVMGIPVKKIQDNPALLEEFDTDTLPGKKVDCHIIQDTYNGRTNNKPAAFLPYGQGRAMAAKSVY
jgi:hypothetical protein